MVLPLSNKAQEYVQQVCEQIRWKKAHNVVEEELLAHIEDQQEAFQAEGMSAEEAEELAVAEMGSPLETGSQFDRIYRPKMEWSIVLLVGVMLILGTILRLRLLNAMGTGIATTDLWGIPVGLVFMMLGYWLDYTILQANSVGRAVLLFGVYATIYIAAIVLFGDLERQYSKVIYHYLVLLFPIAYCTILYLLRGQGSIGFLLAFILLCGSVLLARCDEFCELLLLLGTEGVVLFYALWKNWFHCSRWWATAFSIFPLVPVIMILRYPYRIKRIYALFDPYADPLNFGYISCQILDNLRNATWFGGGTEALIPLKLYLPGTSVNYLLTSALAYWGWSVIVLVLVSYALLLAICFIAFRKIKSTFGRFVALSIISQWVIQILLYVMTNFTAMQIGTYPLLFVQGSAATTCNLFLLGLLLSVYKTGAVVKDEIAMQPRSKKQHGWKALRKQVAQTIYPEGIAEQPLEKKTR